MLQIYRILVMLLCLGLGALVQANGGFHECPPATAEGNGADPNDLILNITGGVISGAPGEVMNHVFAYKREAESNCVIKVVFEYFDTHGNQVGKRPLDVNVGDKVYLASMPVNLP